MSANSSIEWTDTTWNPTTGCTKISPGCAHCYIERTPPFRVKHRTFDAKGHIQILFHNNRIEQPYSWKEPRRVFVNSLSDLFHPDIPFKFIAEVFTTMAQNTRHQFQVLTKRPERLVEFFEWNYRGVDPIVAAEDWLGSFGHIWFGVTVENRQFKHRISTLRRVPALTRFLSIEPLLQDIGEIDLSGIAWVVIGGESGPGARPFDLAWARRIIAKCRQQGAAPFFKQTGENWYDSDTRQGVRGSVVVPVDAPWTWHARPKKKGGDPGGWPEVFPREFPSDSDGRS